MQLRVSSCALRVAGCELLWPDFSSETRDPESRGPSGLFDQLLVKDGDGIIAGQEIAKMGSTGRASSPHVHFEVLYKGKAVNPSKFVKQMR